MKVIMLALCFFAGFLTSAHALELYRCIDNNGNVVITSTPQDGMRDCVRKGSSDDSVTEESKNDQRSQTSSPRSDNESNKAEEKLRRECAKLELYRQEERTYCEGIPKSYISGDENMKKIAQDRMSSSGGSASQNCDYYRGMVRELEAKCN